MVEAFDYKEEKAEKKSINPVKSKNYKKISTQRLLYKSECCLTLSGLVNA